MSEGHDSSYQSGERGDSASTSNTNTQERELSNDVSADTIEEAARKAFSSTSLYLQSELESSVSDLQLLEKLNDASIAKYEGLSRQAQDMLVHAYKIKQTYNEMETQMSEVTALVESIDSLEQVADELDRYSQQLEAKFQRLLK
ncbi:biogenesis of lysosome- organelles complex 1 subunit 2 [Coemansia erecta]|uniref:Biogenesis of lysosome- organelles complex 1 subunit 2 n=1 Tax=Coemansia erecta TaxID=147472 RepID=A0A9W7Y392_9FUNG|nr:biogenesis of lysosome- organelles complex 1 subunit 2 [Coemansia erecta]